MSSDSLPLEGLTVIDLSRVLAGPYACTILADLGARVTKVEPPGAGDETRGWGPPYDSEGRSGYFLSANRNKDVLNFDLKNETDYLKFTQLVSEADILVHNYLPKTAAKLRVSDDELRNANPKLIIASISGFGRDTSMQNQPGYDFIIQAMSGLMSITGPKDQEPYKLGVAITDVVAGLYTAISVLAAVIGKTPKTADISLMHCAIASMVNVAQNYLMTGKEPQRYGNEHPNIVPYQTFSCSDAPIAIGVGNNQQFIKLMDVLGLSGLNTDDRFLSNETRNVNRVELVAILSERLAAETSGDICRRLTDAGVPCGPIQSIPDAIESSWAKERGVVAVSGNGERSLSSAIHLI